MVVRRLRPLPVEAVVRGYLIGSGWKDYCKTGKVSGVALPRGLELAERLREPIFTPSTKAAVEMMPSLAPSTMALSQPIRWAR